MKLETFFEKFDQFADAPNAVAKMRELVLELAVTGRLLAQENRDEPASSLLKSTEVERAKLVAAKKIKSRLTAPFDPDEQPFDVPANWAWARLSDVGYELGQKVPDKRFTYIDVGGIDSDRGCISDRVEKLEPSDAPSRARKLVARGTVIYATVRPYLLNIAIVDQDFDPEPIASTAFGILHPFTGINNRYLFYWLRSIPFTGYVQAGMKGMAYPAINDEKFYSGPIALPPHAEQKRIVAKVDELMALCDRLEAQQQERETRHAALARASLARFAAAPTPANLPFLFHPSYAIPPADLRKSILTLAVQGKLVPQDPNDEPAEDLLHSFRKDQVGCWPKKYEEPQGFSGIHLPHLPSGWHWYRAEQICGYITKGTTPEKTKMYSGNGEVPFLKVYNLTFNGELDFSIHPTFISRDTHVSELARSSVKPNDVLMNIVGPPLGKVSIVTELYPEWNINQAIAVFHPLSGVIGRYLCLCLLQVLELSTLVGAETRGSAGQDNISLAQCRGLPIPLPPLAEQRRIVAKVEQLMALVDALETQLAASRATAANLLAAIVAELTGTSNNRQVSAPSITGSGRRGRPRKA